MGLAKDLRALAKEFKRDPKGQYFRHLEEVLNLGKNSGVSKNQVLSYCKKWHKGVKRP